jgi:hypothetical protein
LALLISKLGDENSEVRKSTELALMALVIVIPFEEIETDLNKSLQALGKNLILIQKHCRLRSKKIQG